MARAADKLSLCISFMLDTYILQYTQVNKCNHKGTKERNEIQLVTAE